jgi:hypothetical protein
MSAKRAHGSRAIGKAGFHLPECRVVEPQFEERGGPANKSFQAVRPASNCLVEIA